MHLLVQQLVENLGDDERIVVQSHDPQGEQIIRGKVSKKPFEAQVVLVALGNDQIQVPANEHMPRVAHERPVDESHRIADGDHEQQPEPDPENEVHLLDKDVDDQDAFYRVVMLLAELAYLEIAEGDARKQFALRQRESREQPAQDVEAVLKVVRIVIAEKVLQEEDLHDQIGNVQNFDEKIEVRQRCARSTLPEQAALPAHAMDVR